MNLSEFMKTTSRILKQSKGFITESTRIPCVCIDGFTVSIQAGVYLYCSPKKPGFIVNYEWDFFELGFPNRKDRLIRRYAEDLLAYPNTVFPYVPKITVEKLIAKHGGIAEDEINTLLMMKELRK